MGCIGGKNPGRKWQALPAITASAGYATSTSVFRKGVCLQAGPRSRSANATSDRGGCTATRRQGPSIARHWPDPTGRVTSALEHSSDYSSKKAGQLYKSNRCKAVKTESGLRGHLCARSSERGAIILSSVSPLACTMCGDGSKPLDEDAWSRSGCPRKARRLASQVRISRTILDGWAAPSQVSLKDDESVRLSNSRRSNEVKVRRPDGLPAAWRRNWNLKNEDFEDQIENLLASAASCV